MWCTLWFPQTDPVWGGEWESAWAWESASGLEWGEALVRALDSVSALRPAPVSASRLVRVMVMASHLVLVLRPGQEWVWRRARVLDWERQSRPLRPRSPALPG